MILSGVMGYRDFGSIVVYNPVLPALEKFSEFLA